MRKIKKTLWTVFAVITRQILYSGYDEKIARNIYKQNIYRSHILRNRKKELTYMKFNGENWIEVSKWIDYPYLANLVGILNEQENSTS